VDAATDPSTERGRHAESRLSQDHIGWLTTVRPSGQPDTVPVWFLWRSGEIWIYSRPNMLKLRNLEQNPRVSLVLDDTHGGQDVVRVEGMARVVEGNPAADQVPAYVEKYAERIRSGFGSPPAFASTYSVPVVVTPTRIHA
jgi:PPOX class probable F420-dependent enzyme